MTSRAVFIISLCLSFTALFAQTNDIDIYLKVLQLNKPGKEYKFNTADSSQTYLTYLGHLNTKKGEIFKILTSKWIWGLSHRATSRILVYDSKNKYIGGYYVTMIYDLPEKIDSNKLIFLNIDTDGCDKTLITEVSFADGIPGQFFLKCKGNQGDIYRFSRE